MSAKSLFLLFFKFFKLGGNAWGGPFTQIQMMKEEFVDKEKCISGERFKKTLAVYQALPGPEATELAIYFGMIKSGKIGAVLAGLGFILPGFLFMLFIAYLYNKIGVIALMPWFIGLKPAITALIYKSAYKLSKNFIYNKALFLLCIMTTIMTLLNINGFIILVFGGVFYMLNQGKKTKLLSYILIAILLFLSIIWYFYATKSNIPTYNIFVNPNLFIEGLKAGLLTFGGAYTAIPFLENSLVNKGILEQSVFLDAIAFANLIPSPLIMFATFLGYHINGIMGASLITVGIFLPAFIFTLLGHNIFEKIIHYKPINNFLDGFSASIIGLLWITTFNISFEIIQNMKLIPIFIVCICIFGFLQHKFIIPLTLIICGIIGKMIGG